MKKRFRTRSFIRGRMPLWLKAVEERLQDYILPLYTREDWQHFQQAAQAVVMGYRAHYRIKAVIDARLAPEGFTLLITRGGIPVLTIDLI